MAFLKEHPQQGFTVDSLWQQLRADGLSLGRTTVYRHLIQLLKAGLIQAYSNEQGNGRYYRFVAAGDNKNHYQLQCLDCGEVIDLKCPLLAAADAHIETEHNFQINSSRSLLFGTCGRCRQTDGQEEKPQP